MQTQLLGSINTGGEGSLGSSPPAGQYKITNIYVDTNGKFIVEYDDTPT